MADAKKTIKDFLTGTVGAKMLQESAEEWTRDNITLKGPELAKAFVAKLPSMGKFGEELKKIDGFKYQLFSQVLAGLGEGWILSLPIDVSVKTALKQMVGGGIIGVGSGVADIVDDAGWEKTANASGDEYIARISGEKVIACSLDNKYYPPKMDGNNCVVTDPTYHFPVPLDSGLLRIIDATKGALTRTTEKRRNRNRQGGQDTDVEKTQNPLTYLHEMTEKEAQAAGFEPSDSYRKYKKTKSDEEKAPTWTKNASMTLRRVHSAAVHTASRMASEQMLGIDYDVMRDFLEDAKKSKNVADLEQTAKNIVSRIQEDDYLLPDDLKYYVASIDCDEGNLENKTKVKRWLAAAWKKVGGDIKTVAKHGALWLIIPSIMTMIAVLIPFFWPRQASPIGFAFSLGVTAVLLFVQLSASALERIMTTAADLLPGIEAKGGWMTNLLKKIIGATVFVLMINGMFHIAGYPFAARLTLLGLGMLWVAANAVIMATSSLGGVVGKSASGLSAIMKVVAVIGIVGNVVYWPAYSMPLEKAAFVMTFKWQNTAAIGQKAKLGLTIPTPDGKFATVENVFGPAFAEEAAKFCPMKDDRPCSVAFPKGMEVKIPGFLTRSVPTSNGQEQFLIAQSPLAGKLSSASSYLTSGWMMIAVIIAIFVLGIGITVFVSLTRGGEWGTPYWIAIVSTLILGIGLGVALFAFGDMLSPPKEKGAVIQISVGRTAKQPPPQNEGAAKAAQDWQKKMCATATDPARRALYKCP